MESVNLNEIYRIYVEEALKKIHSCCQILLRKRANCFKFYLKMKRNTRFQSGSIWKSFLLMFIADVHTNDALMGKIYYQHVQSRQHFCKRLWIIENTCNIFVSLRIKYWNESFLQRITYSLLMLRHIKRNVCDTWSLSASSTDMPGCIFAQITLRISSEWVCLSC